MIYIDSIFDYLLGKKLSTIVIAIVLVMVATKIESSFHCLASTINKSLHTIPELNFTPPLFVFYFVLEYPSDIHLNIPN